MQRLMNCRTIKLIADGRKVLVMRERGASPQEMLQAIGGSRPRMYRAVRAARYASFLGEPVPIDPLLL